MSAALVVRTTSGRVRGALHAGVRTFTAIPYAATMTGPARFAVPAPAPHWDGVREATTPGGTAPAPDRSEFGGMDLTPVLGLGSSPAADYLTVTISTPEDPSGGLPVLVFIHGGGLISGTGQAPLYDGSSFARNGVIVVTLNYRLGIAGWLDIPGAPANRGLLDVAAALRWVAENARAFGGDPGKITVAGQSAGAMIVAALLANSDASSLFARAISQSGSGVAAITTEQASSTTRAVAEALNVRATPEELGAISDGRLTEVLGRIGPVVVPPGGPSGTSLGNSPFRCVIDGQSLDRQPATAVREGRGADVDLFIGTNRDEANLYTVPSGRTGGLASWLITEAFVRGSQLLTDAHACHRRARTFAYEFAWRSAAFNGALGACHCVELPFVFHQLDLPTLHGDTALLGPRRPPADLADHVHAAWTAFVRDGDPGWAPYDTGASTVAVIDVQSNTSTGRFGAPSS